MHHCRVVGKEDVEGFREMCDIDPTILNHIGFYLPRDLDKGVYVAVYDVLGSMVGICTLDEAKDVLWLSNVVVRRDKRKGGYGTDLIKFAEKVAKREFGEYRTLNLTTANDDLIPFYQRLGFETVAKTGVMTCNLWNI